jgi:hypothetical protein
MPDSSGVTVTVWTVLGTTVSGIAVMGACFASSF